MKISEAIKFCLQYQKANSKVNTVKNYEFLLGKFGIYNDRELESITTEEVLSFLTDLSDGRKQNAKRGRYMTLSAFFNLIINTLRPDIKIRVNLPLQEHFSANRKPINGLSLIRTRLMRPFTEPCILVIGLCSSLWPEAA